MFPTSSIPSRKINRPRSLYENQIIKKRDKQFLYDELWNERHKYYERFTKLNDKFNEWTSPRYYNENNELMKNINTKRQFEENLMKRREKLRKLFLDDEKSYEIELMIYRTNLKMNHSKQHESDQPSTSVLRTIATSLQLEEDDRRRTEAEWNLYRHWRGNNPLIKNYERKLDMKTMKLSWLDQQIEKQIEKERTEEENRKILKEFNERKKYEEELENERKKQNQLKLIELKSELDQQLNELKLKENYENQLKSEENKINLLKNQLYDLKLNFDENLKITKQFTNQLINLKFYKLKLMKTCEQIELNLINDEKLINELNKLEINHKENQLKLMKLINEINNKINEGKLMKRNSENLINLLFESEMKDYFQKQNEFWLNEERKRQELFKEIFQILDKQISTNLNEINKKQINLLNENEELLKRIDDSNQQLDELNKFKENEEIGFKNRLKKECDLKKDLKENTKISKNMKLILSDLENCRKEEERLKQEIIKLQQKQNEFPRKNLRNSQLKYLL